MWLFSVFHLACYFKRLLFCAMHLISFLCTTKIVIYEESTFLLLFLWVFFFGGGDSLCNPIWSGIRQPSPEFAFLPQPPECWYFRCAPSLLTCIHVVFLLVLWKTLGVISVLDLQIVLLGTYCLQVFEWMCVLISPGYIRGVEFLGCMVTLYNWPRSIKLLSDMFIS